MKWSSTILLGMLIVTIAGLLASNMILKNEYDKVDKNDNYWTFEKVLDQHFRYLKVEGGNITRIRFEQSPNCSIRVANDWQYGHAREKLFSAFVSNDTLYVKFTYVSDDEGEKFWMKRMVLVRIFSPELSRVEAANTNLEMFKLKQKSISINISGRSNFEVESFIPELDTLIISQRDTAQVVFEMSPEYKAKPFPGDTTGIFHPAIPGRAKMESSEAMTIRTLNADLQGNSILDVGHAQIQSVKLNIADSSSIIFSGGTLRKFCQQQF